MNPTDAAPNTGTVDALSESGSRYAQPEPIEVGKCYEVRYPFVRDEYQSLNEDGPYTEKSWRPGIEAEPCGPEDVREVADAIGAMLLTVIDVHKPGRFPTRVFFTRRWRTPDGKTFGKGALRWTTLANFRVMRNGFRVPYVMRGADGAARTLPESAWFKSRDDFVSFIDGITQT